jgi:tripartite-type tricarboxylate transporter receptor subunit TctC
MMGRWLRLLSAVAMSLCAAATGPTRSQAQTQGVIKVVVPFTAGSPNDLMARLIVEQLPSRLGRAVIVDNRPGAGSTIGAKAVATAIPDGNTLLFISSSLVIDPALYSSADYDPIKSFAPIAAVAATPWVMVVTPRVPARSVGELVAYAKAHPGKLNFGYALGTASQLVGELFKISTGTDITSIPYKGGTGVVPDMLGGRIDLYFGTAATILPLIREGKLNALAITSAARSPQLPDVPTMIESGLSELSLTLWQGMLAPARTPTPIINTLNRAINESLTSAKLRATMADLGFEAKIGAPEDFAAFLAEEAPRWAAIVKASGAKVN